MSLKLSNNKKRKLLALADQAMVMAGQGLTDEAERLCNQADGISADFPEILFSRGIIAAVGQDYERAAEWFGKACDSEPKRVEFLANHAGCLRMLGMEEEAAERYRRAVKLAPKLAETAFGYAASRAALGEYRQALEVLMTAVQVNPRNSMLLRKLAAIHNELGDNDQALTWLQQAHRAEPGNGDILRDMGLYHIQSGDIDAARKLLRQALTLNPGDTAALSMLIESGVYPERDADIERMRSLYALSPEGSEARTAAAFVLGAMADKCGEPERAFELWSEGNRQRAIEMPFDEAEQDQLHQAARRAFAAERLSQSPAHEATSCAPVFIVGMPRSGSTLLEQALSRHPGLQASGEMYAMEQSIVGKGRKVAATSIIEALEQYDDEEWSSVGYEYERRLTEEYRLQGRIIDKALNNYLYAGAIAKALPAARIIHIAREPMASALSMFRQDFVNTIPYSFELSRMGRHYGRYLETMRYWRESLPTGVMLETSYEELVEHPEQELQRLLGGIGLAWDENCLEGHRGFGMVATASRFQVREPIHRRSVARWQAYAEQLEPFRAAMNIND